MGLSGPNRSQTGGARESGNFAAVFSAPRGAARAAARGPKSVREVSAARGPKASGKSAPPRGPPRAVKARDERRRRMSDLSRVSDKFLHR